MSNYSRGISALAWSLGHFLVILGGAKLNGIASALGPVTALGVPTSFVPVIAWGELLIGVMLIHAPLRKYGGSLLAAWMIGALTMHLRQEDFAGAALPMVLLTFGVALVISRRRDTPSWTDIVPAPLMATPPQGWLSSLIRLTGWIGPAFMFRWAIGGLLFWASLPFLGIAHARRRGAGSSTDALHFVLLYLLFFGFGFGGLWNFTGHFFMSDMVAASTGWPAGSPFQHELAFYHLGSGIVGILCFWWRDRFWLAAGLAPSVFVYGAAIIHIREFLQNGNAAPANWGFAAVGANLIIPSIVLALLFTYLRRGGFTPKAAAK